MTEAMTRPEAPRAGRVALIAILIAAATLGLYSSVSGHAFLTFDDGKYVTDNPVVRAGLTSDGVRWAFTTTQASNWHPLTWLSHMLDVELFGLDAGRHHLMNAFLHALNAALLFVALVRLRAGLGVAAIVALLFAAHPLRVESVAWVSERKDVLSGLFWMLGLLAWSSYVRAPHWRHYVLVALCLTAGLLAKPMLVSFPFVLLLLDLWPLERFRRDDLRRLVLEKLPLILLVAASAAATVFAQGRGGAISDLEALPVATRISNSLVATMAYLGNLLWPTELAAYYPHPALVDPDYAPFGLRAIACGAVLLLITAAALRTTRRAPWFLAGWGWTLITLVPVIGLVQVGTQAMADRYAYLPMIGPTLVLVAGGAALVRANAAWRGGLMALAALAILAAGVRTRSQIATWSDSVTLFEHALEITERNAVAHVHLGGHYATAGDLATARGHYEAALEIVPTELHALTNLGTIASQTGQYDEARDLLDRAVRLAPDFAPAQSALGTLFERTGDQAGAIRHYELAVAAEPWSFAARANLGSTLLFAGKLDAAEPHLLRAAELQPEDSLTQNNLGVLFQNKGQLPRAANHFEAASRLDPTNAHALYNLGVVREDLGADDEALTLYRQASSLAPELVEPELRTAALFERQGRTPEALTTYRRLLTRQPPPPLAAERLVLLLVAQPTAADAEAAEALRWARFLAESTNHEAAGDLDLLAAAYAATGETAEAVRWQARALELTPVDATDARTERERRRDRYRAGGTLGGR